MTIKEANLGGNPGNHSLSRIEWGLSPTFDEQGKEKGLWLPSGIVIPTLSSGKVIKLKIRRQQWIEGDHLPKYVEITGGMKSPSLFGTHDKVVFIVESELDALLVKQMAGDLCSCMALGGASKKPDRYSHEFLQKVPLILFSLDFDQAGKRAFQFWKQTYSQLKAWPVPTTKSPGDAFKAGLNLREWIACGIQQYTRSQI